MCKGNSTSESKTKKEVNTIKYYKKLENYIHVVMFKIYKFLYILFALYGCIIQKEGKTILIFKKEGTRALI